MKDRTARLSLGLLLLGVALRSSLYIKNRPLWYDEYLLTFNILTRSYTELLMPLSYDQGAPIGFLIAEKVAINLFGNNEYVLRLIPFACGIVSLVLFFKVASYYLRPQAVPIAIGLFAVGYPLVYYSAEVKQYSSDVAISLLLQMLALYSLEKHIPPKWTWLFAIVGSLSIWFSHPALFTLSGIIIVFGVWSFQHKAWQQLRTIILIGSLFLINGSVVYTVSLRDLSQNHNLLHYWQEGFLPFPPTSIADFFLFSKAIVRFFITPGGIPIFGVGMIAVYAGCMSFLQRSKPIMLLLCPTVINLIASMLRIYPFSGRLVLYLVPTCLVFIAEGIIRITEKEDRPSLARITLSIAFLTFAIFPMLHQFIGRDIHPDGYHAYALVLTNVCALVSIISLFLPIKKDITTIILFCILIAGMYEANLFYTSMVERYTLVDWREVATIIEQKSTPDEPVILIGWYSLPLMFYLQTRTYLVSADPEFQDQRQSYPKNTRFIVVRTIFSEHIPSIDARSVVIDNSVQDVQILRYAPQ